MADKNRYAGNKQLWKYSVSILFFVFFLFLMCSTQPGQDLAGGSGAGNPGGNILVAIVIDTSPVLSKQLLSNLQISSFSPVAFRHPGPQWAAGIKSFDIRDSSETSFLIDSVKFRVRQIQFVLDDDEDAVSLAKDFEVPLIASENILSLDGKFTFDAISGSVEPSLDSLKLPVARYKGVQFILQNYGAGLSGGTNQGGAITIKGSFLYKDTSHSVLLSLNGGEPLRFVAGSGTIEINQVQTSYFLAALDARRWLHGVNITGYLDDGKILLDDAGALILDNRSPTDAVRSITASIQLNLNLSARLNHGQK